MTLAMQKAEDLITEMFGPESAFCPNILNRAKLRIFAATIITAAYAEAYAESQPPRSGCEKEKALMEKQS